MKRILFLFVGLLFLFSCEYQDNGVTSINDVITSEYLLAGNLDVYLQNAQVFRHKGKPGIETITIGNDNLSDFEDCFVMYVASGTTQATIVSSAIIKLDDMVVLNTSDFSKNTGQHTFEVCNLTPTSVLTVEVRGEPGSYIDIWMEGKKKELTVSDCDGNIYKTVKIGEQIWMAENLKTTKFNNCEPIPFDDINSQVYLAEAPSYCFLGNDESNKAKYGALYNYFAVGTGKLCPDGWHVSSYNDFQELVNYLGGNEAAFPKLIDGGSSGLDILFAGMHDYEGTFGYNVGILWLSTNNCFVTLSNVGTPPGLNWWPGVNGWDEYRRAFSVRCVKGN
jgi:hypothetical protein